MFIINFRLNMFRASLCPSSGEQRPSYCIWCIVLALLDVVGSSCGALSCRMWALWRFLFNYWTEWCPKHVETEVKNKHLNVASCWFFYLHILLTMHGYRNLKLLSYLQKYPFISKFLLNTHKNIKNSAFTGPLSCLNDNKI